MESKRSFPLLQLIAISVAVNLIIGIGFSLLANHNINKMAERLDNAFDEVDRKIAVEQLSELKGRVEELNNLLNTHYTNGNTDVLHFVQEELYSIEDWSTGLNNPYLKDVTIDFSSVDRSEKSTELYCRDLCTYAREFLAEQIRAITP